jgi:hypothetical protein
MAFFWIVFGAGFALLAVAAGVTVHARRRRICRPVPMVDDALIAQIIEHGAVRVDNDDPLDLDTIEDEEERFWSESWDEPQSEW